MNDQTELLRCFSDDILRNTSEFTGMRLSSSAEKRMAERTQRSATLEEELTRDGQCRDVRTNR